MSGKHDKKLDDEQSAKLLLTGPIVIRGLRRSVKDALLPGRPSRHRAFVADGAVDDAALDRDEVSATPIQRMLASGPTAPVDAPSSELADGPVTQAPAEDPAPFPSEPELAQTEAADGHGEDRVDDRREDEAPLGESPVDEAGEQAGPAGQDAAPEAAAAEPDDVELDDEPDAAEPDLVESAAEAEGYDDAEAHAFVDAARIEATTEDQQGDEPVIDFGAPQDEADDRIELLEETGTQDDATAEQAEVAPVADDAGEDDAEDESAPETDLGRPDGEAEPPAGDEELAAAEERIETLAEAEPDLESPDAGEPEPDQEQASEDVQPAVDFGDAEAMDEPEQPDEPEEPDEPADAHDESIDDFVVEDEADPGSEPEDAAFEETIAPTDEPHADEPHADERPADGAPVDEALVEARDDGRADAEVPASGATDDEPAADADAPTELAASEDLEQPADDGEFAEQPEPSAVGEDAQDAQDESAAEVDAETVAEATEIAAAAPDVPEAAESDEAAPEEPLGDAADGSDADATEDAGSEDAVEPVADEERGEPDAELEESAPEESVDATVIEPVGEAVEPEAAFESTALDDGEHADPAWSDAEHPVDVVDPDESHGPTADETGADEPGADEPGEQGAASDVEDSIEERELDQPIEGEPPVSGPVDEVAEEPGSSDVGPEAGAVEDEPAESDPETEIVLAEFLGQRGWTTAEELYSRPITLPTSPDEQQVPEQQVLGQQVSEQQVPEEGAESAEPEAVTDAPSAGQGAPDDGTVVAADIDEDSNTDIDEPEAMEPEQGAAEPDPEPEQASAEPAGAAAVAAPAAIRTASRPAPKPERTSRPPRRPRPARERFGREAIGIAVLVVLALVCGGLITAVVLKTQKDAAVAAQEAANYTPPPLATPTPAATGPVVAVIGDGTTSSAASGVSTASRWSALLGTALSGTVTTDAASGMGYAAKSGAGETFVQAAAKVPSNAQVIVFFGGASDANVSRLSLAKAATDAFSAAKTQAPKAKLLVVGPVISAGANATDLTAIQDTLRSATAIAKGTWIDPIGDSWLSSSKQTASSPTALTAADEKTIESKMEAAVKKAIG